MEKLTELKMMCPICGFQFTMTNQSQVDQALGQMAIKVGGGLHCPECDVLSGWAEWEKTKDKLYFG